MSSAESRPVSWSDTTGKELTLVRVVEAVVDRVVDKMARYAALVGTSIHRRGVTAVRRCCQYRVH